jgi:hypothetical protein
VAELQGSSTAEAADSAAQQTRALRDVGSSWVHCEWVYAPAFFIIMRTSILTTAVNGNAHFIHASAVRICIVCLEPQRSNGIHLS